MSVSIPSDFFADAPLVDERHSAAAESFDRMGEAGAGRIERRRSRGFKLSLRNIDKARTEMDEMSSTGDWSSARGVHLVALFAWLHLGVYQVECGDLDAGEWARASAIAQRFCAESFGGDFNACVEYVRWCWSREVGREKWRRENGRSGGRLSCGLVFSNRLLTDYRIDKSRVSR